jgi:C_GCAxxG_C_C family probable redox protein
MSNQMSKKEKAINKARKLGTKYEDLYLGCSESSFAAICDALREEADIELVTPEEQDKIFTAMVGLQGGIGGSGKGSCGAVTGSCFCVSLASGIGRKEQLKDKFTLTVPCENVRNGVTDKFQQEYGSICCCDICFKKFGKSFDFTRSEVIREFLTNSQGNPLCTPETCTISNGAAWAVEKICDMKGIR